MSSYLKAFAKQQIRHCLLITQRGLTSSAATAFKESSRSNCCTIECFTLNELQVNLMEHFRVRGAACAQCGHSAVARQVPPHVRLSDHDADALLCRTQLRKDQLPIILTTDPVARYMGLTPGQLVKITRPSQTTGVTIAYRVAQHPIE